MMVGVRVQAWPGSAAVSCSGGSTLQLLPLCLPPTTTMQRSCDVSYKHLDVMAEWLEHEFDNDDGFRYSEARVPYHVVRSFQVVADSVGCFPNAI